LTGVSKMVGIGKDVRSFPLAHCPDFGEYHTIHETVWEFIESLEDNRWVEREEIKKKTYKSWAESI